MTIPSYDGVSEVRVHALDNYLLNAGEHACRSHRHEFWQCILFGGAGVHSVDLVEHHYKANSLLMLPAGAVHRFDGQPATGTMVHFSPHFFARSDEDTERLLQLRAIAIDAPFCTPPDEELPDLQHLGAWLRREARRRPADLAMLRTLVHTLSLLFIRCSPMGPEVRDYIRFMALVETRYTLHKPIPTYARALQMSDKRLYQVTHEAVGKPPGQLVDDRLLLEAKRRLIHSNEPVSQVGFALGFEDAAYFSRFFKKRVGQSPRAFRKTQITRALSDG